MSKGITLPFAVVIAVIGAGVGYYAGNVAPFEEKVATQELPLITELLTNPVYYEWWASAEGTVVAKTDDTLTLEKDGRQAVVKVNTEGDVSRFYRQGALDTLPVQVSYEEVQVGDTLRGGVNLARKGTTGLAGEENVAFGTSFVIVE